MALEIERKFHINFKKGLPFLLTSSFKKEEIIQSYIEKSAEREIRIRKITNCKTKEIIYNKTTKYGEGFAREEIEEEISIEDYNSLLQIQIGTVRKIRFTLSDESSCFDYYPFINLITFEKEFESVELAESFIYPSFLKELNLKEITGNKDFSNFKLAKIYETLSLEN